MYLTYPDVMTTVNAGKEIVRLVTTGQLGQDAKHTTGVFATAAVGITAFYPGKPGATVNALGTIEQNELSGLESTLSNIEQNKQLGILAFDPTPWLGWIQLILDLLRRMRQPNP